MGCKTGGYKRQTSEGLVYQRGYACQAKYTVPALREAKPCQSRQVKADYLEDVVWSITRDLLLNPEPLVQALDELLTEGSNAELLMQINYLKGQIGEFDNQSVRLQRAYMAGAFDEIEFAESGAYAFGFGPSNVSEPRRGRNGPACA